MERNLEEAKKRLLELCEENKQKFLRICKDYNFQEVYVNFSSPFYLGFHYTSGEVYVVPRALLDDPDLSELKEVFNSHHGINVNTANIPDIEIHLITGTLKDKEESVWNLVQNGFKLLYYKGAGICFE